MFIDFNVFDGFNNETYILEVKTGNQIQRQRLQGTTEMIQLSVLQLINQAGKTQSPVKIKVIKQDVIWDALESKEKHLENYLQFANKSYIKAFPNEF